MKSLRKSFSTREQNGLAAISGPLPAVSKPSNAVVPPQKVIRALSGHRPVGPTELPFQKGDFFYVIREVNDGGAWYEAHNPLSGARGLVPRALFDEFSKHVTNQRTFSTISKTSSPPIPAAPPSKPKPRVFYATVLYDFEAQRNDELDCKAGDAVSVVAQSNREWFVAKPIGKLGRPGLIPASFVEVKDPATGQIMDVKAMIDGVGLPSVEEWKKEMLTYKANSIALGTLDDSSMNTNAGQDRDSARFSGSQPSSQPPSQFSSPQPSFAPPPNMASPPVPERDPYAAAQEPEPEPEPEPEYTQDAGPVILPDGVMISGNVVSFHKEMDEYWFRVHALFQPYGPEGTTDLPPARQLVLFRAYNDFYDFQVQLLEAFPREGGQDDNYPRVLPYMPGPAEEVTDQITANRQSELDEYLRLFCELRGTDQRYILEDVIVREFLAPKPGDVETEVEPASEEVYGYADSEEPDVQDMTSTMANMGVVSPAQNGEYDDEAIRTQGTTRKSHARSDSLSRRDDDTLRPAYGEQGSSSSQRNPSPIPPHMRTDAGANGHSSARGAPAQDVDPNARTSAYSRTSSAMDAPQSAGSSRSSGGRSRADAAINSPPISANNPQPAFVKIKVFDANNDLIAVRVHPRVTHAQLVEKISQRLGVPVSSLRYKDSRSEAFLGIDDDYALQDWIETTDKLVLWAE